MSSHPVERVTTSGADTEAGQHRAGEFATVGRVGKYVRDDAVQLKRLGRLAQSRPSMVASHTSFDHTIAPSTAPTLGSGPSQSRMTCPGDISCVHWSFDSCGAFSIR